MKDESDEESIFEQNNKFQKEVTVNASYHVHINMFEGEQNSEKSRWKKMKRTTPKSRFHWLMKYASGLQQRL
jgi:hypothetical protein